LPCACGRQSSLSSQLSNADALWLPGRGVASLAVTVEVHDNPDERRYEVVVDSDLAGFAAYITQQGLIAFMHTEVKDAFGGHGVGTILIREALDDARRRGFEVLPFCPFVSSFIAEHREFADLVPGSRREEFGL
jgi:predicted GNAT family acetyltransferase